MLPAAHRRPPSYLLAPALHHTGLTAALRHTDRAAALHHTALAVAPRFER